MNHTCWILTDPRGCIYGCAPDHGDGPYTALHQALDLQASLRPVVDALAARVDHEDGDLYQHDGYTLRRILLPTMAALHPLAPSTPLVTGGTPDEVLQALLHALAQHGIQKQAGRGWRVETPQGTTTHRVLAEALGARLGTRVDPTADAVDADRWRTYASSPQTALMLGSLLDPNDSTVDWIAECARLVDAHRARTTTREPRRHAR
jgi:hypothetical protein